jgi:hypothetical protein
MLSATMIVLTRQANDETIEAFAPGRMCMHVFSLRIAASLTQQAVH